MTGAGKLGANGLCARLLPGMPRHSGSARLARGAAREAAAQRASVSPGAGLWGWQNEPHRQHGDAPAQDRAGRVAARGAASPAAPAARPARESRRIVGRGRYVEGPRQGCSRRLAQARSASSKRVSVRSILPAPCFTDERCPAGGASGGVPRWRSRGPAFPQRRVPPTRRLGGLQVCDPLTPSPNARSGPFNTDRCRVLGRLICAGSR